MEGNTKARLIVASSEKELWFVENKYNEAEKLIGNDVFKKIIRFNVLGNYANGDIKKTVRRYFNENKKTIRKETLETKLNLSLKWKKIEKSFFKQCEAVTGRKWLHDTYKIYLTHSCFWGGDYDINKPNIYINPLLKQGDPLYVIFHELSHLLYWEYVTSKYPDKFIDKNYKSLWRLSEIMVNYPLLKIKINFKFTPIIPKELKKLSNRILPKFKHESFTGIIDNEINKPTRN